MTMLTQMQQAAKKCEKPVKYQANDVVLTSYKMQYQAE